MRKQTTLKPYFIALTRNSHACRGVSAYVNTRVQESSFGSDSQTYQEAIVIVQDVGKTGCDESS